MNETPMTCANCHPNRDCKCMHHKMVPALVAAIGLVFLLKALEIFSVATADILWPILLMLAGLIKMTSGNCKCYGNQKSGPEKMMGTVK